MRLNGLLATGRTFLSHLSGWVLVFDGFCVLSAAINFYPQFCTVQYINLQQVKDDNKNIRFCTKSTLNTARSERPNLTLRKESFSLEEDEKWVKDINFPGSCQHFSLIMSHVWQIKKYKSGRHNTIYTSVSNWEVLGRGIHVVTQSSNTLTH